MVLAFGLWDSDRSLGLTPGLTLPPFPTAPSSFPSPSLKPSFLPKQPLPHPAPSPGQYPQLTLGLAHSTSLPPYPRGQQ